MNNRIAGLLFVLVFVSSSWALSQPMVNGLADLRTHNFDQDGPVYLWGNWEFYFDKLLTPQQLDTAKNAPDLIMVPGSWHRQGDFPSLGVATYRAKIKLPSSQRGLSIYFRIVNSSAKFYLNGIQVAETGKVSRDRDEYKAKLAGTIISIPEGVSEVNLVIQAANFSYFSGGIAGSPELDLTTSIFDRTARSNGIENFFAGCLIAMFIYQLILYFLFERSRPFLWLSLICLGVALRALIVHGGSFLLPNLYPSVEWEYWKKIEFGCVYGIIGLFPLYVYHLFKDYAPRQPLMFFTVISAGMCLFVIFTPQYIYGKLLEVSHIMFLLSFLYAFYSIGVAWRAGNRDARIILFGVLAAFPFIVGEILKNSVLFPVNIEFEYMVELGVLVFLLFQVYLLANHYAKSYKNLEVLNLNLEKVVNERTLQLSTANNVKDRLLSVMSHDIRSPLNSLRGLIQIYNKGAMSQDEFSELARHVEGDLSKTSLLVAT